MAGISGVDQQRLRDTIMPLGTTSDPLNPWGSHPVGAGDIRSHAKGGIPMTNDSEKGELFVINASKLFFQGRYCGPDSS